MNSVRQFTEAIEELHTIARRCAKRDAIALNVLIGDMRPFQAIVEDIDWLRFDLRKFDALLRKGPPPSASQDESAELVFALLALAAVSRFLNKYAPSRSIELLKAALSQVSEGSRPTMFRGRKGSGRPSESQSIHQVKGVLAGLMYVKQRSGMRRGEAAAWIARNIPRELASRLSPKPITIRALLEWLDRYGGKHPPRDPGGRAFRVWSRPPPTPLTVQKFKEIMTGIAEWIPAQR
jgi:hypothetical protein